MTLSTVIEYNRRALLRLVVMLFEASGLVPGEPSALSRGTRSALLYSLQPAEAAVRRLIFALARRLTVTLRTRRAGVFKPIPRGDGSRAPAFPLFDRRPSVAVGADAPRPSPAKGAGPNISFVDGSDPVRESVATPAKPAPDAPVDGTRLCRRLQALKAALEDLPKQAKRMARAMARRKLASPGPGRVPPLRPGRPPGHRARGRYEIDEILRECHRVAHWTPPAPDTS